MGRWVQFFEYAALIEAVICLVVFEWARIRFFIRTGNVPPLRFGLRPLGPVFAVGAIATLFLDIGARVRGYPVIAMAVFVVSIFVFFSAVRAFSGKAPAIAFTSGPPDRLLMQGPYRYVRHPFYLSYILFWAGVLVASPGIFTLIACVVMLALYVKAAKFEEAAIMNSTLAAEYALYKNRTGMFLPGL